MTKRLLLTGVLLATTSCAFAQSAPPAPARPNGDAAAPIVRAHAQPDEKGSGRMPRGEMRGSHEAHMMLPPGTWWRDSNITARIGLTADQQKHMDEIFMQSRVQLIHLHASLEEEELMLEPLMNENPVDQAKAMARISKLADERAELEKTNAKMLLGIRAVLTADQWTKLQAEHRGMRGQGGRPGPPPQ